MPFIFLVLIKFIILSIINGDLGEIIRVVFLKKKGFGNFALGGFEHLQL